jgi:hypothetical protein
MSRFWLPLRIVRGHPRLFAGMAVSAIKADYDSNRALRLRSTVGVRATREPRHNFFQLESGLKLVMARARWALSGPKFFS